MILTLNYCKIICYQTVIVLLITSKLIELNILMNILLYKYLLIIVYVFIY